MVPARSPKVMSRSTTNPSIWLKTGRCRASGVSRRKHFPGITAWMGSVPERTASSMRWTCTGEVWVRSSTVSGSPMSRYKVSYMPRAGWAGGMFSASKLYQSDSASGPSATLKPMPTKTSSSSSRAWVTRWRWPRAAAQSAPGPGITSVRSRRSARSGLAALGLGQDGAPVGQLGLEARADLEEAPPGLLARLGAQGAQGAVRPGQRGALAEVLGLDLREHLRRVRARDGPFAVAGDALHVEIHVVSHACRSLPPSCDATCPGPAAPALAERLEADHRAGHADVERLRPPGHGDGERPGQLAAQGGIEPGGLVAQEERRRHGPVEVGVVLAVPHDGGEGPEAGRRELGGQRGRIVPHGEGDVEQRSRRGPHGLGVVRVDGLPREEHRRRARGVRGPQHRAGVARVADVDQHDHQRAGASRPDVRSGGGSSSMGNTASTGWGVTVSATRSSTPAPRAKTRTPAAVARRQTSCGGAVVVAVGRHVHRLEGHAGLEGAPDELRALGHEGALAPSAPNASAAGRAAGGPAGA